MLATLASTSKYSQPQVNRLCQLIDASHIKVTSYDCSMAEPGSATPKYQVIADDLRMKILDGQYRVGEQLPTKADLMTTHGVALTTIDRALEVLREWELIETRQGVGTFVRSDQPVQRDDLAKRVDRLEEQVGALLKHLGITP